MVITKKAVENTLYIESISRLLKQLALPHKDISIYILAFTHRSIVNERPDFAPQHNERLEFLGDAVLELIITDNLYNDYPEKPEGELTDIRSALVRGRNLSNIAKKLGFSEHLILGKGEELGGGKTNEYLLANVVEALIGAIYLDLGIQSVKTFINKYIYSTLDEILKKNLTKDFKTLVQEYSQAEFEITPHYKVLQEIGPDHDKSFTVGIYQGQKQIGEGKGSSKKKAQEEAAKEGFQYIKNNQ